MATRELVVLGTSSMLPTRHRAHNSYALRWDNQLVLFDPGEGAQRGCTLTGVAIARATAVCVTHFHGDHCLGLPGVIQRRSFDNSASPKGLGPLPVFYPGDGEEYFERLHHASIFHDTSNLQKMPVTTPGPQAMLGPFELSAQPLEHRDTTFGYRIQEPDGVSVDGELLAAAGVSGPDVGRLLAEGSVDGPNGTVTADQVTVPKRGQSMAFVMDTLPCDGALELARDVDMLVIESTYLHAERELAQKYKHMTARQAAELATEAGAKRLVLTHFSARYPNNEVFGEEARNFHNDVHVAEDLATIPVPPR
jgi:ribonuclease Z